MLTRLFFLKRFMPSQWNFQVKRLLTLCPLKLNKLDHCYTSYKSPHTCEDDFLHYVTHFRYRHYVTHSYSFSLHVWLLICGWQLLQWEQHCYLVKKYISVQQSQADTWACCGFEGEIGVSLEIFFSDSTKGNLDLTKAPNTNSLQNTEARSAQL